MTTKEHAKELIDKYLNASFNCKNCDMPFCESPCTILDLREAKECALITVDEICDLLEDNGCTFAEYHDRTTIEYWLQVKKEIEKL
jgi:hypothetical protein